ncbi:hypothetical protein I7I51_07498 [Histoplasma capsulatum]|uniref:Major facilitator superfamily (MFS) profile domain-containing protein n=1 Tax=Ajellomyces capsulatus TaxID=5037 RepID=A0A8A1LVB2_AJECA|nr:hypothetical protein I7I51_07498 [Histoplasma capsulatum]
MESEKDTPQPSVRTSGEAVPNANAVEYPSGAKRAVTVLGILFGVFVFALDISIISTAIPRITTEFNSLADVGWYGSAFFLTLAATQSIWGNLYKYFSLRGVFITSIAIFEIGSITCAVAPNSPTIIAGRAVQSRKRILEEEKRLKKGKGWIQVRGKELFIALYTSTPCWMDWPHCLSAIPSTWSLITEGNTRAG